MSAVTSTLDAFKANGARAASGVEVALRTVAQQTGRRMHAGVVARMRKRTGQMAGSVRVVDDTANRQIRVEAGEVPGRNPMVPVWHEFGTSKMPATPAFGPAADDERARYGRDGEAAIAKAVTEGLG